jgi:alcohol dehydrogenase, propanol-preferring
MAIPSSMRAMIFEGQGHPLVLQDVPVPQPGTGQILIHIQACGICRTDLHIVDGELPGPKLPLVPGHEVVGRVARLGEGVDRFKIGERIGVPWLGYTDGTCRYCQRNQENLCDHPLFTGYTLDGGYAEYMVADQRYCFNLPDAYTDTQVAPLLCAGLIGYRTYRLAGSNHERFGVYGFGAAAHIITQIAVYQGKKVYAFTKPGDDEGQAFAHELGAVWAGGSNELPPVELDAALIFAPVGSLIVNALKATGKGGVIVSGGIHMSDIPSFPYRLLWEERVIRSVANLTRQDGEDLFVLVSHIPLRIEVQSFPLELANEALEKLRSGQIKGAAVLSI